MFVLRYKLCSFNKSSLKMSVICMCMCVTVLQRAICAWLNFTHNLVTVIMSTILCLCSFYLMSCYFELIVILIRLAHLPHKSRIWPRENRKISKCIKLNYFLSLFFFRFFLCCNIETRFIASVRFCVMLFIAYPDFFFFLFVFVIVFADTRGGGQSKWKLYYNSDKYSRCQRSTASVSSNPLRKIDERRIDTSVSYNSGQQP